MNTSYQQANSNCKQPVVQTLQTNVGTEPLCNAETCITPPDIADKYTYVKLLGKGSQGCVYEAIRNSDQLHVAIKALNISSIQNWKEYDLFWREVETIKTLNISGVARFYEVIKSLDSESPHAYLVQQCIEGKTLDKMIHSGYRFSVQHVFGLALQLLDIIEQLHNHDPQIIHRDIKPSNIILEPNGSDYKVYLTDFGAVFNPVLQKGGSTVAGTYGYMPPEQLMGHPTPESDIYALGATLVCLLSGMDPAEIMLTDFRLSIEKPLEKMPYSVVSCLRRMTMPNASERLCDLIKIRTIFTDFSQGNFVYTDDDKLNISNSSYSKALKKVKSLGEKGNYDLWLHLPEHTPRPIPQPYRKLHGFIIKKILNRYGIIDFFVQIDGSFEHLHPKYLTYPSNYFYNIIVNHISLILITIPFYLVCLTIMLLIRTIDIIFRIIKSASITRPDNVPLYAYIRTNIFDDTENPKAYHDVRRLLENGRKAMATITDIQYEGIKQKENQNTDYFYAITDRPYAIPSDAPHPELSSFYVGCNVMEAAPFRITYTFNPPDDATEVDLVHQIFVPFDPSLHLKPGDMLPILYDFDPKTPHIVKSMPFPYPIKKIVKLTDIYCETNSAATS